ncbi:MAG: hypothetical protein HOE90_20760 [Bacteriovoracaceae bacterium]|nr:hypothetical protein [Bacteriovoracaceae bacterium]
MRIVIILLTFTFSLALHATDSLSGFGVIIDAPEIVYDGLATASGVTSAADAWVGDAMGIIAGTSYTSEIDMEEISDSKECAFRDMGFDSIKDNLESIGDAIISMEAEGPCGPQLETLTGMQSSISVISQGWSTYVGSGVEVDEDATEEELEEARKEQIAEISAEYYYFVNDMLSDSACFEKMDLNTIVSLTAGAAKMSAIIPSPVTWAAGLIGTLGETLYNFIDNMAQYYSEPNRTNRQEAQQELSVTAACILMNEAGQLKELSTTFNLDIEFTKDSIARQEQEILGLPIMACYETYLQWQDIFALKDNFVDVKALLINPGGIEKDKCEMTKSILYNLRNDNPLFMSLIDEEESKPSGRYLGLIKDFKRFSTMEINCDLTTEDGEIRHIDPDLLYFLGQLPGALDPLFDLVHDKSKEMINQFEDEDPFHDLLARLEILEADKTQLEVAEHFKERGQASIMEMDTVTDRYEGIRDTFMNPHSIISYNKYAKMQKKQLKEKVTDAQTALKGLEGAKDTSTDRFCDQVREAKLYIGQAKLKAKNLSFFCEELTTANEELWAVTKENDERKQGDEDREELDDYSGSDVPEEVALYTATRHKAFYKQCHAGGWKDVTKEGVDWTPERRERARMDNYVYYSHQFIHGSIQRTTDEGEQVSVIPESSTRGFENIPTLRDRLAAQVARREDGCKKK